MRTVTVELLLAGFLAIVAGTAFKFAPSPEKIPVVPIFVSPAGSDHAKAVSAINPYRTVGYALAKAAPGTTIFIKAGQYQETLVTQRDGTPDKPITIKAAPGAKLVGQSRAARLFTVKHDYYVIEGLEFRDADILLWLEGASYNTIKNNYFHDAEGECIRLKYRSSKNRLADNRINDCGREDFTRGGGGKNGEGIYIGTAPEQLYKNPTPEIDQSNNNTVNGNSIATNGNECVDIKEGSANNLIEGNDCSGQKDPESAGFDSRGNHNIFRYNQSHDNVGAGIRFGGDTESDGIYNEAYGNNFYNNQGYAIKVTRQPQGKICGNETANNKLGFSNNKEIHDQRCD